MLDVDEDGVAALVLSLSDGTEAESGFTRAFGAVDFADTSAG